MSVRPLKGRVALGTGANQGIGASTALALAELGAKVVVTYLRLDGTASGCRRTPNRRSRGSDRLQNDCRTTAVALQTSTQIGTSGVLAGGKHARRRAAWATPRTGDRGHPRSVPHHVAPG
jgi:NAD(P)-dependent dehydrogenase (short-subunit alcohol dehydrogenase family)